jgi:uncharacterized protein YggE
MRTTIRRLFLAPLLVGVLIGQPALADETARQVSVGGEAEVRTSPDRARLQLAVDKVDADIAKAQQHVNDVVRRYLELTRELGAAEGAVSTSGLRVMPEYQWDERGRSNKLVGYRVRRDITVRVDDLAKLGDFLLGGTRAGINHVQPPELESSRAVELEREALGLAAADAQERARLLAAALGATLGAPRRIDAQQDMHAPPMPMMRASMQPEMAMDSSGAEMGLATGEIVYRARVSASFDLVVPNRR